MYWCENYSANYLAEYRWDRCLIQKYGVQNGVMLTEKQCMSILHNGIVKIIEIIKIWHVRIFNNCRKCWWWALFWVSAAVSQPNINVQHLNISTNNMEYISFALLKTQLSIMSNWMNRSSLSHISHICAKLVQRKLNVFHVVRMQGNM